MPLADIGDAQIHFEMAGDGSPLALLLPQSRGPVGLAPLHDALAQDHKLLTYDQRGTGRSSPAQAGMSMSAQASDLVAVLDALAIERASLLCHSTGCGIGISVAAQHPDRVENLVLASPWTHADWHLTTMQNLRIELASSLAPVPYAHFNASLLYPPDYRRSNAEGFEKLANAASEQPHNADAIRSRLQAILSFDARPLLAQISSPTLVITARDDQLMPSWFADEAAADIANSELIQLDTGGHMILETNYSEVSRHVLRFLGEQSA